jgi:hypothetical protein
LFRRGRKIKRNDDLSSTLFIIPDCKIPKKLHYEVIL